MCCVHAASLASVAAQVDSATILSLALAALFGSVATVLTQAAYKYFSRDSAQRERDRAHEADLQREREGRDADRHRAALRTLKAGVEPLANMSGGWIGLLRADGVPQSVPFMRWLQDWGLVWQKVRADLIDLPDLGECARRVYDTSEGESLWQSRVENPQQNSMPDSREARREAALFLAGEFNAQMGAVQATIDSLLSDL